MKKIIFSLLSTLALAAIITTPLYAFEDVTPEDAYALATTQGNVFILDVRTPDEWAWVGHPGSNKLGEGAALIDKVLNISYKIDYKGGIIINPSFLTDVEDTFSSQTDAVLITMCRSGKRSVAAATVLEAAGFNVLNMVTGFQGGKDAAGYRSVNGWVNAGLPYSYSGTEYQD